MDPATAKRDRLRVARIRVEITATSVLPEKIKVKLGNLPDDSLGVDVTVEYPWKPGQCDSVLNGKHHKRQNKLPSLNKPIRSQPPLAPTDGDQGGKVPGGLEVNLILPLCLLNLCRIPILLWHYNAQKMTPLQILLMRERKMMLVIMLNQI
ncbi:hypothetical protein Nepgr_009373 [Nepenthes gracilis]|uniref:Uncharacterized protein n=1 Tax=Nepenthes gracilis TaxID=150966 RepID=A0AAD3SAH4_NEPGR|nr:hypothetical protein Nepgr_009373 [Nepenthes gracilis]